DIEEVAPSALVCVRDRPRSESDSDASAGVVEKGRVEVGRSAEALHLGSVAEACDGLRAFQRRAKEAGARWYFACRTVIDRIIHTSLECGVVVGRAIAPSSEFRRPVVEEVDYPFLPERGRSYEHYKYQPRRRQVL